MYSSPYTPLGWVYSFGSGILLWVGYTPLGRVYSFWVRYTPGLPSVKKNIHVQLNVRFRRFTLTVKPIGLKITPLAIPVGVYPLRVYPREYTIIGEYTLGEYTLGEYIPSESIPLESMYNIMFMFI